MVVMRHFACLATVVFIVLVLNFAPVSGAQLSPISHRGQGGVVQSVNPVPSVPASKPQAVAEGAQRIITILIEFPDRTHEISGEKVRGIMSDMDAFYKEASYGLMWIAWTVTDKWYQVKTPLGRLDIQKWNYDNEDMDKFKREAITAADDDVDYRNYDYVFIVGAGKTWPNSFWPFKVSTNDGINEFKVVVVNEDTEMGVYAHELGHALPSNYGPWGGGLPDLYSYDAAKKGLEDCSPWIGPWDLMDWNDPVRHFSAWSKITLGWLTPEKRRLNPATAFVVDLQPLEKDSGTRAVVVPLTTKTSYVIEVRRRIGYDRVLPAEGVLVYFADLSQENGHGVVRVIDAKPKTKALEDAPFKKGDIFEDSKNSFHVLVAYTDGVGFTIVVSGSKVQSLKDTDQDGLLDSIEAQLGTDAKNPDTDGDWLKDGEEVNKYGTDPLKSDTDGDGLPDGKEVQLGTDPLESDTDDDGLTDAQEVQLGTNAKITDTDADGLRDGDEVNRYGTNPLRPDTDDDGVSDSQEVRYGTDPLNADTDDDGLPDGDEVQLGANPLRADSDEDGLLDGKEIQMATNPLKADTDGDYWRDGTDLAPTNLLIPNVLMIVALVAVTVALIVVRKRRGSPAVSAAIDIASKTTFLKADTTTPVSVASQFCVNCGSPLPLGSRFCRRCGAHQ